MTIINILPLRWACRRPKSPRHPVDHASSSRHYGGRRLFLRHLVARAQTQMPRWRHLRLVDWDRVERIVFVCKGNICRSAYAAAKATSLGLPAVSAGLEAKPGLPADDQALRHAASRCISLSAHRTRRLAELTTGSEDLVVCMEPPQLVSLARMIARRGCQVTLLGFWSRPIRPWIFDPYGLSDAEWESCLDIIDGGIERLAAERLQRRGALRNPSGNF